MATKLKDNNEINSGSKNSYNKKNIVINLISFVILACISFGLMCFYPKLKECAKNDKAQIYEDNNFFRNLYDTSFVFYKDILEYKKGENVSLEEAYINNFSEKDYYNENYDNEEYYNNESKTTDYNKTISDDEVNKRNIENEKKSIINELESSYLNKDRIIKYDLKNLEYSVFDNANNMVKSNVEKDLLNSSEIQKNYDFYAVIKFDKTGFAEVEKCYGIDEYSLVQRLSDWNHNYNELNDYEYINAELNPISDAIFVYAVPKDLKYEDDISQIKAAHINGMDSEVLFAFIITVFSAILILSFFVPYKKAIEIIGIKFINKLPTEINIFIYMCAAILSVSICIFGVETTLNGEALRGLNSLSLGNAYSDTILFLANLVMWSIIIYAIFSGVILLKHIFKTGFVLYLKENLLIVKIYNLVIRNANKIKDELYHLDLRDKSNKLILKIVIINFVILLLISIIWVFGIGAAAIYSIILFFVAVKYVDNIKAKFSKLIDVTNKIAEGNLDAEVNEDLGVFNPLKEPILNIRKGFKNAVDEEVKSQRMKTELISNVSHDLKTPLTSIITYVDLLKNPNITEEERKSYVDTLDKKSQRLKFLIEDLFEVSKATSGNIKLNLVKVDIVELMRQTQIELQDKLKNSKLVVRNDYPENKVILNLDSQKTYRVFENLLNNVAKYAMENSRVYVNIVDNIDAVEITIKNMSANEINFTSDEIVERFQRGDKSRNTEGSGLGLAIAKSFVEAQGGRFNIEIDGDLFKVIIVFNK